MRRALAALAALALAPSVAAARSCPEGEEVTVDTDGHCCWPGQVWSGSRGQCIGVPQCPPDRDLNGETCVAKPPACPIGKAITPDTEGHCCWQRQVWSASRSVCVGTPECPAGFAAVGEDCRATTPPEPAPSQPGETPSGASPSGEPGGAKKWLDVHPVFGALLEGWYFTVPNTRTTAGGGFGLALRGGVVNPLPVRAGTLGFALRAGAGLEFAVAADSPAGTNSVSGVFWFELPLYVGFELRIGDTAALGIDWRPTILVVASGGHDAEAMNPLVFAVSADLFLAKTIHPRGELWLEPAVLGMPFAVGVGLGVSYF